MEARDQALGTSYTISQAHHLGIESEVDQPALQLKPIQDTGIADGGLA